MRHRHLNHERLTPAAIDDIIARGAREDWAELGRAVKANQDIRGAVRRIVQAKAADHETQRYHFWKLYAE